MLKLYYTLFSPIIFLYNFLQFTAESKFLLDKAQHLNSTSFIYCRVMSDIISESSSLLISCVYNLMEMFIKISKYMFADLWTSNSLHEMSVNSIEMLNLIINWMNSLSYKYYKKKLVEY